MKKIKSALAYLCALALSLSLLVVPTSAAGDLFFLSLNDTLAVTSTQTTPVQYSGWVYVPVGAFSSRVTGVNFGIYYGFTNDDKNLVFYNLSGKTLTFDLEKGTATAVGGETPVPGKALRKNGTYYVPAYAVCRYFGLTYSFHTTEYGPLLRIKDGNAVLSDALFLNTAASLMRSRVNSLDNQTPSGGNNGNSNENLTPSDPVVPDVPDTPDPSVPSNGGGESSETGDASDPVAPEIQPGASPAPTFSLSLGIKAAAGADITPTLNALSGAGAGAVVFFPAESLAQSADQIRQAAGRGHKVGLIPKGDTPAQRLESVKAGSAQLAAILRQETWFVLASDQELTQAGYLCWTPGLSLSALTDATKTYNTLLESGKGRTGPLRLLVETQSASGILAGVLNQLAKDGDTFLAPRETRY